MQKIWIYIIIGVVLFLSGACAWAAIFPRTVLKLNGKFKQKAKRGGTNLVKDMSGTLNTKKSLKRAKTTKRNRLFKRKNKKL